MRRRAPLLVAALAVAGLVLAACSNSGAAAQAEQACVHVYRSIAIYDQSLQQTNNTVAANERQTAQHLLLVAEPLAASATSSDGSWNGLQTTLIESARVSEGNLLVALRSECAGVVPGSGSGSGSGAGSGSNGQRPTTTSGPTLPPGA